MNQLEQLKQFTTVVADTGNFKQLATFAPRDATVHIGLTHVSRRHSHEGRALAQKQVNAAIEAALADPRLPRLLKPGRKTLEPAVTAKDLPARYPAIITVERSTFTLRYFHRLKLSKTYKVAVGQPAYPTPTGLYSIANKQVNPAWHVPMSDWAGALQGQVIPGGAPKERVMASKRRLPPEATPRKERSSSTDSGYRVPAASSCRRLGSGT